jgi:hypothetical protein
VCREMDTNPSKDTAMLVWDDPLILNEFMKLFFFLDSWIHIHICKQLQKVHSNWAAETLGDLQSTSRGFDAGVKCKMHTISILMHQIHNSTNYVSLVMLRLTNLKILNVMAVGTQIKHKQNAVIYNQIRRLIELCIREMILRFEMNL